VTAMAMGKGMTKEEIIPCLQKQKGNVVVFCHSLPFIFGVNQIKSYSIFATCVLLYVI